MNRADPGRRSPVGAGPRNERTRPWRRVLPLSGTARSTGHGWRYRNAPRLALGGRVATAGSLRSAGGVSGSLTSARWAGTRLRSTGNSPSSSILLSCARG